MRSHLAPLNGAYRSVPLLPRETLKQLLNKLVAILIKIYRGRGEKFLENPTLRAQLLQ